MSEPQRDPHQLALIEAASRMGIRVEDLLARWRLDAVRYHRGERSALVFLGRIYADLSAQTDQICDNKIACKAALQEIDIPTPPARWVDRRTDPAALDRWLHQQAAAVWVCKPVIGTNGVGVVTGLPAAQVSAHLRSREDDGPWLIEAHLGGEDLRLQAIGGELVAACVREPAAVVGDGRQTLDALIAARAAEVHDQNPQNALVIDAISAALLAEQGVALADVPAAGRVVRLKSVANIGQGGRAIDVTDRLHPAYGQWMRRIAARLGISIFAMDVICDDHRADPEGGQVGALEINAQSQWLHHTFSERRQHDIPALILDALLGSVGHLREQG